KGSAWMTASNIISRMLGAIYIIPWYAWMGEHGNEANSLFSMGYTIYGLFLMISTAGIPAAIAKQTCHYNSLNQYKLSQQL
ncbi:oligosaccharide flippase family protein, partial [Enterococcus faecalis]|uniref:oligosaccharide flippase family protein n=1 Tax=Enterococcus faecalis TaxID=1351 RepID=UPI003D6AC2A1